MSRKRYYLIIFLVIIFFLVLILLTNAYNAYQDGRRLVEESQKAEKLAVQLSKVICEPVLTGGNPAVIRNLSLTTPEAKAYCQQIVGVNDVGFVEEND